MLASHLLMLSIYVLTFLTGVPANLLAFCTFLRKVRCKPAPIDILLLNLTVSDLIFLAFLPFKMKEAVDGMVWNMPYFLCPLTSFLFYAPIYTSTLFLTAVSVERYLGVAFPIRYRQCRRPRYAVSASAFFWLLGLLNLSIVYMVPLVPALANHTAPPSPGNTCYSEFNEAQLQILLPVRLELFLALFLVPLLICCFCYVNFIRILSRLPHIGRKRRLRAIGLALGTLLVFAVCFGPYNTSHVVGFVRQDSEGWRDLALTSSTLNACLDPVIFYFSSSAVRSALSHCLCGLGEKAHVLRCRGPSRCCPLLACSRNKKFKDTSPPDNS